MKILTRLFSLFAATAMIASCAAPHIAMNTVDNKGSRIICTSDLHLFKEFSMAMGAKVAPKDTVMALLITSNRDSDHGIFDTNDRLLIRLGDGSEITLTNIYDHEFEKNQETSTTTSTEFTDLYSYAYDPVLDAVYVAPVTVRTMVPRTYTYTTTKSYALYLINKQQVHDIIQKGVVKLRVEVENDECDMASPQRTQKIVAKLYPLLMQSVETGVSRTPF